ncbi:hypothetical protein Vadar_005109 [Vaccinium darrowii]|uniref:Uncharacterized protein n=1 Tax=Vaccinium darrowii TaxID=229202 RepID=A0ACB7ZAH8_9ERIC|nr:hypothetical protein Vadar_005109 [Vaccinium darrowii]
MIQPHLPRTNPAVRSSPSVSSNNLINVLNVVNVSVSIVGPAGRGLRSAASAAARFMPIQGGAKPELFTAGTDTSTSTVEWAMAELLKNAKSMTKVRQELVTEIKQSFPKNSHLPQLPYLQACVKETLRLHPPAPFLLPHRAFASCEVMNYTIPKDAQVIVNVWAIGKDPMIWEDPLQFKPERFLNSTLDYKGNDYEFLPFGAGRRICPGLPMAAKHVPLVLASLIHFFDWSLPDEIDPTELDMSEKFGVTLEMEQPLLLIPKVRK